MTGPPCRARLTAAAIASALLMGPVTDRPAASEATTTPLFVATPRALARSGKSASARVSKEAAIAAAVGRRRVAQLGDGSTYSADATSVGAQEPILGPNDLRISDMGPDGNTGFPAQSPSAVYNPALNEYFVVWVATDDTPPLVAGESEVFGQRIDAATGLPVGTNDFRISRMGPDGNPEFDVPGAPHVAYNSTANEYLVVWVGDDNRAPLVDDEFEVFGQRLDASTGVPLGATGFRISDMGPDGSRNFGTGVPDVAFNPLLNEYLVVWSGTDNTAPLVEGEFEVFGQRLSSTGAPIGTNDFRISDMGPDGNPSFSTQTPRVVFNPTVNEYLVAWRGDDNTAPLVNDEFEMFGQRLSGSGAEVGPNDFRISDMGPDGNAAFGVFGAPAIAYNSAANEYLIVWAGDDGTFPLVDDEAEIFGQRLSVSGAQMGSNDFRISTAGPDGSSVFGAVEPSVSYNTVLNEYLVVWSGDDDTPPLVDGEVEIFGQRLSSAGVRIGTNDFRISTMGPNGNPNFDARTPSTAFSPTMNQYLVVWSSDDNTGALVDGEIEIYGQRLDPQGGGGTPQPPPAPPPAPGFPPTPTNLVPTVAGSNVVVQWNASPGAASYRLFATGPGIVFNQNVGNTTSVQGFGLPFGAYTVQVFALNAAGENPAPVETAFTIGPAVPAAPAVFTPTVTGRAVSIRWSTATGATSYRLRATLNGVVVFDANVGNSLAVFAAGVPPGRYFIDVFGVNAAGQSATAGTTVLDVF